MTIIYEHEAGDMLPLEEESLAADVINASLDEIGCPYEVQVSLTITDSSGIQEMNKEFRDIDAPTDVLSFPMLDYEQPGDFSFLEEEEDGDQTDLFDPESGELVLGDIVINSDRVFSQANEFGHSIKREYAFLIAHSMLHLAGYDHIDDDERLIMEEKQNDILDSIGYTRDC